ncbi:MAG: putative toxin-antitoxin system toxin component, PIN family [Bacteroidetes bacterium CG12_big_fil_rev_8_21_14_0_65_60_17]|nr:MAG: putative toxin-antitoxin system toxin component, PIN family [Bacteroidetes bacterium CG12_big_fil_rev_8_21_14_0_65_60_17]
MKVAFDTNVLISAYSARGLSSDVFRLVLAEHVLLLSERVLSEFERVLVDRFGIPVSVVADFLEELRLHEVVREVVVSSDLDVIRDPDDRIVVASAREGQADVLVTGDKDILDVRDQITGIMAMTPREFWESIRNPE